MPDYQDLMIELDAAKARDKRLTAAMRALIGAGKGALSVIRERSYARKPLVVAIEQAQDALEPLPFSTWPQDGGDGA